MTENNESKASSEWVAKLQDSLTDIKITSANIDHKLEQMKDDFSKVEASIAKLSDITAKQEVRITLVEEKQSSIQRNLPHNLSEDIVLMKSTLASYQKFLWIVASGVIGLLLKMLMEV